MSGREMLIYLSVKYNGDFIKMLKAIQDREIVDEEKCREAIKTINAKTLTILDSEYPDNLKRIYQPPLVLYYYGNIALLNDETIKLAVVGSRDASEYGKNHTKEIVKEVSKELIIISGLARGIDAIAHQACIDNKGRTIAVLGSGIDYIYPNENKNLYEEIKKNHLLISEYPNKVKPIPNYFPLRNRIISGIADKLLVTEAYMNSGTNITVMYALKQGKDVMALPYEANSGSSCNKLIQDGAFLVENAEDVLFIAK